MNIQFHYLYRDAGNYKNYGDVTFSNPENLSIIEIERFLKAVLIDGKFFYAEAIGLPTLYFNNSNDDDHAWHEYDHIKETEAGENDTSKLSIRNLIDELRICNIAVS